MSGKAGGMFMAQNAAEDYRFVAAVLSEQAIAAALLRDLVDELGKLDSWTVSARMPDGSTVPVVCRIEVSRGGEPAEPLEEMLLRQCPSFELAREFLEGVKIAADRFTAAALQPHDDHEPLSIAWITRVDEWTQEAPGSMFYDLELGAGLTYGGVPKVRAELRPNLESRADNAPPTGFRVMWSIDGGPFVRQIIQTRGDYRRVFGAIWQASGLAALERNDEERRRANERAEGGGGGVVHDGGGIPDVSNRPGTEAAASPAIEQPGGAGVSAG